MFQLNQFRAQNVHLLYKAFAAWQWFNYCTTQAPEGKVLLKINLDETSICLFQGEGKGNILLSKKRPLEGEAVQRIPHSRRRMCLTHVAFVCDRPELQHLMPQIVVGNESILPARAMTALRATLPANVRLIRQKSSWNNSMLCAIIVRILALALRPHRDRFQPVLLLDTVRLHFAQVVLNACNNCGIWPLLVPAKTAWFLQPLDTHVFRAFKCRLRKAYQRARIQAAAHDLTIEQFMPCLLDTIRLTIDGRDWSFAFGENGFGNSQADVKESIKRALAVEGPLSIPSSRPTHEQLQAIFPRRTTIPTATLWKPFDPPVLCAPRSLSASSRPAGLALPGAGCLALGRARSSTQHLQQAQAAASSSVAAAEAVPRVARGYRLGPPRATVEGE